MTETIIAALIAGGVSLTGVIIGTVASTRKTEYNIQASQRVTDTKLELLTNEVRKHNDFATRIPVLENDIAHLKQEISDLKER